jgi:hypothetical protein
MRMMSGWMRTGVVAGVAAMMVAAISAGAQTTADDAAKAADAQAIRAQVDSQVQAQAIKAQVDSQVQAQIQAQAQMSKMQADVARQAAQLVPLQAKLAVQASVVAKAQVGNLAPLQTKLALQVQMAPMMAKMDMMMAPMQAEMLARSAQMQVQMLARSVAMQAGMVSVGDPQVKDDLFAGTEKFAKGASDVTDVNLGPDMLGMVSGKHGGDMAHKLNFMVVRTYEYPRPGMYSLADVDEYRQKLKTGNWNCFIHTHESESGESTDICSRALPNGEGNEMVILTVEPKELTFIHMSGKGSLADLGKLGKMGGMGGIVIPDPPDPPIPPAAPAAPHQ